MQDPDKKTVTKIPKGNPEGKGLNGFMLDWYRSSPRDVVAKPQRQILSEFFTSMLVLSASFKYKPVVAVPNYLYWMRDEWSLESHRAGRMVAGTARGIRRSVYIAARHDLDY